MTLSSANVSATSFRQLSASCSPGQIAISRLYGYGGSDSGIASSL
jgi:hypothetical protein